MAAKAIWWHCSACHSNALNERWHGCFICGSGDVAPHPQRIAPRCTGQLTMFQFGTLDQDLICPDDHGAVWARDLHALLRVRDELEAAMPDDTVALSRLRAKQALCRDRGFEYRTPLLPHSRWVG